RDISQLFDAVWQDLAIFNLFRWLSIELRTRPSDIYLLAHYNSATLSFKPAVRFSCQPFAPFIYV
ncbi:MAG: hypothetical protein ACTHU5_10955, partial [Psychrobacter sp.]